MKRILIISDLFYPSSRIGAIRPTKLAKYLHEKGYQITVFSSNKSLTDQNKEPFLPFKVYYAGNNSENYLYQKGHSSNVRNIEKRKRNNVLVQELKMTKRQLMSLKEGYEFKKLFISYINSGVISIDQFDCVFSTFGPIGSLLCGLESKKRNPKMKWINDFRDPMVSQIMPKLLFPIYANIQKKSIGIADHTTTVSDGYATRMSFSRMKKPIHVISNGFDKEDLDGIPLDIKDPLFSFAYVGALYEGKRDVSILFKQLKKLVDLEILNKKQLSFHYAGGEAIYLIEQAKQYDLDSIIIDHGVVSRSESIALQSFARFLVLATWNDIGEEGVFPGKLLEYMLLEKPVISLVGGTLANSEVTQIINDNNLGVSYESASPDSEKRLFEWLKIQALRYKNDEGVLYEADRRNILRCYDWVNVVERFCELIDD